MAAVAQAAPGGTGVNGDRAPVVLEYESDLATEIELTVADASCTCPVNSQRDCYTVTVTYVPARVTLELSHLKQWIEGYSEARISHEHLTSELAEWLIALLQPAYLRVETAWEPIEGVGCVVRIVAGE